MIAKRFRPCPQNLWITLWASWAVDAQVLDSSRAGCRCSICWQRVEFNKIKELACIRANPDGPQERSAANALQHDFWG
jgi:hypothetical protein